MIRKRYRPHKGGAILRYVVTREEMQAIDSYSIENIGIPSMVLMERAAMAVTQEIVDYIDSMDRTGPVRVLIVTESGNNGGDGLAVARMLYAQGYQLEVIQIGGVQRESEAYRRQKQILENMGIPVLRGVTDKQLAAWKQADFDVIVDAVFGIGLTRDIMTPQKEVLQAMNDLCGLKCAVDLPSGLDATTGRIQGMAFRADITVTFGCAKTGQFLGEGPDCCGVLRIADIGFPSRAVEKNLPECYCYEEADLYRLPNRNVTGNKGTFGKVTVIAGSETASGAAFLSAKAAYKTGCGLVEIVTHVNNREALQKLLPEALLHVYSNINEAKSLVRQSAKWADLMVIGPAIGTDDIAQELLRQALISELPLVVDADAITVLSGWETWKETRLESPAASEKNLNIILTPHMKEMERISRIPMERLKEAPWKSAKTISDAGCVCVLKDARTIVTEPGCQGSYFNMSGNDGMATGGSGDVLSGVIASLAAQGMTLGEAARWGVYLHGLAGDLAAEQMGHSGMLAGDIADAVSEVLRRWDC